MKKINRWVVVAVVLGCVIWVPGAFGFNSEVRQALQMAAEDVQAQLAESRLPRNQAISVLPLGGDSGRYVEGLLKNAVTASGLMYVEGREDPFWDQIMAEVEWDERKDDMLDPDTLTRFGRLKSSQLLLYGNVREARQDGQKVFVEIELHLSSIETKQHLWGTVVTRRFYLPGPVEGIVALDPHVRNVLNLTIAKGLDSLQGAGKLGGVQTVAVVPLAGDIDRYVTQRATDILSRTHINPMNLDVRTLGEARQLLRDRPERADAVLYGALRDLSKRLLREEILQDTYEVSAEVQLTIQSASTGEILWSDTLDHVEEVVIRRTVEEILVDQTRKNPRLWVYIGVGLVVLILGARFLKAATRVR